MKEAFFSQMEEEWKPNMSTADAISKTTNALNSIYRPIRRSMGAPPRTWTLSGPEYSPLIGYYSRLIPKKIIGKFPPNSPLEKKNEFIHIDETMKETCSSLQTHISMASENRVEPTINEHITDESLKDFASFKVAFEHVHIHLDWQETIINMRMTLIILEHKLRINRGFARLGHAHASVDVLDYPILENPYPYLVPKLLDTQSSYQLFKKQMSWNVISAEMTMITDYIDALINQMRSVFLIPDTINRSMKLIVIPKPILKMTTSHTSLIDPMSPLTAEPDVIHEDENEDENAQKEPENVLSKLSFARKTSEELQLEEINRMRRMSADNKIRNEVVKPALRDPRDSYIRTSAERKAAIANMSRTSSVDSLTNDDGGIFEQTSSEESEESDKESEESDVGRESGISAKRAIIKVRKSSFHEEIDYAGNLTDVINDKYHEMIEYLTGTYKSDITRKDMFDIQKVIDNYMHFVSEHCRSFLFRVMTTKMDRLISGEYRSMSSTNFSGR